MNRLTTLPSAREQAYRALLLLGAPAPARLVAEVHAALFDGDLSVRALATLLRDEERAAEPVVCPALLPDLSPARGHLTLAAWPVERRLCTPAHTRADLYAQIVRIAEFAALRPGACPARLLRGLAAEVPGGPEAISPADAARLALADPALEADLAAEAPGRATAAGRAGSLDRHTRLFGVTGLPHQRGGA